MFTTQPIGSWKPSCEGELTQACDAIGTMQIRQTLLLKRDSTTTRQHKKMFQIRTFKAIQIVHKCQWRTLIQN